MGRVVQEWQIEGVHFIVQVVGIECCCTKMAWWHFDMSCDKADATYALPLQLLVSL